MARDRVERIVIVLVALHSYAVGFALLFLSRWSLALAGWDRFDPPFFVHQGGAFHLVVATGYLVEYVRHRGVTLLLVAKATACVFLLVEAAVTPSAWAVPFAGVADGLMGLAVWLVHRRVGKSVAAGLARGAPTGSTGRPETTEQSITERQD